jgi:hypothetical protein
MKWTPSRFNTLKNFISLAGVRTTEAEEIRTLRAFNDLIRGKLIRALPTDTPSYSLTVRGVIYGRLFGWLDNTLDPPSEKQLREVSAIYQTLAPQSSKISVPGVQVGAIIIDVQDPDVFWTVIRYEGDKYFTLLRHMDGNPLPMMSRVTGETSYSGGVKKLYLAMAKYHILKGDMEA